MIRSISRFGRLARGQTAIFASQSVLVKAFSSQATEAVQTDEITASPANNDSTPTPKFRPRLYEKGKKDKTVYNVYHAVEKVKLYARATFDETVEIAIRTSLDPRKPNQSIKGVAKLPSGSGKKVRVAVFATGANADAARAAGAELVGSDDLIEKIKQGETGFERAIATPDMMAAVGKIGKILGPRGLMPNPKMGTVTQDVVKAINDAKAGSVQFRVDKTGNLHSGLGKVSFTRDQLLANIRSYMISVMDAKPEGYKGKYLTNATISSTMGPGLVVDMASIDPNNAKFMVDPSKL